MIRWRDMTTAEIINIIEHADRTGKVNLLKAARAALARRERPA